MINKSLLAIIIRTIFEELEKEAISTELIQLPDVHIKPCRITQGKDRLACMGKDNCVFKDDEGMANMRNIGQNMAWLIKQLWK